MHLNSCENTHRDTNTNTHSHKKKFWFRLFSCKWQDLLFNGQLKLYYTHIRVAVFCIYSSVNGHRDWFCVFAFCKMCCKKHDVQVLFWYANFNSFRECYPWKLVISIVIALFPFPPPTHPLRHSLLFDFILWLIYFILYVCVSFLQIYNYTMCMIILFYMYVYPPCKYIITPCAWRVLTEGITRRYQIWNMVVNHLVGVENKTQVLSKSTKCSETLKHLSRPCCFLRTSVSGLRQNLGVVFICISLTARSVVLSFFLYLLAILISYFFWNTLVQY